MTRQYLSYEFWQCDTWLYLPWHIIPAAPVHPIGESMNEQLDNLDSVPLHLSPPINVGIVILASSNWPPEIAIAPTYDNYYGYHITLPSASIIMCNHTIWWKLKFRAYNRSISVIPLVIITHSTPNSWIADFNSTSIYIHIIRIIEVKRCFIIIIVRAKVKSHTTISTYSYVENKHMIICRYAFKYILRTGRLKVAYSE